MGVATTARRFQSIRNSIGKPLGDINDESGILILLSQNDGRYRLSVGYGLESVLTDEESAHLAREMVPMLQKGDYGGALLHLAERIHDESLQKVK